MKPVRDSAFSPRPLEVLGIDEQEERTYRVVLSHRLSTAEELAKVLSFSLRRTQQLLDRIEFKGLVSHSPSRPRRYVAAPPEFAVEALIARHQARLEASRSAIGELKEAARSSSVSSNGEQAVEVFTGRAAVEQLVGQLFRSMKHEMVGFQRAPVIQFHDFSPEIAPGVKIRSVTDMSFLALPGAVESIRLSMEHGEDARLFPTLPVKMVVFDRRIGMIPLDTSFEGYATLVFRTPSMIDAFYALFELIWERATPIAFTRSGKLQKLQPASAVSQAQETLLTLLAAGLNDKAITHEAGISATTLNRRIADLMKQFDTRTRFQLGWRAASEAMRDGSIVRPAGKGAARSRASK